MEQTQDKIVVQVAELMGDVVPVEVVRGSTVRQVINTAGMTTKNLTDVRVNAEPASLDTIIDQPDTIITLVPRVEGGIA